jgi:DNA-binding NtrC family response regulator
MALLGFTWHKPGHTLESAPVDLKRLYHDSPLAKRMRELEADEWLLVAGEGMIQLFAVAPSEFSERKFAQLMEKLEPAGGQKVETVRAEQEHRAVRLFLQSAIGWMPDGTIDLDYAEKIRQAYTIALEDGFCGAQFNRLFQRAVWVHERLRLETPFYRLATGEIDLVVELIEKIFGRQQSRSVLVAGQTSEAKAFGSRISSLGFCQVMTALSTLSPSETPSKSFYRAASGRHIDIVLLFEAAFSNDLSRADLQKFMESRSNAPLLFFDLRPSLAPVESLKLYNLYFYNRADLQQILTRNRDELKSIVALAQPWLDKEAQDFISWRDSDERFHYGSMVGGSPQMLRVFELIARIAQNDITVLIEGESGTGKELVARAIHDSSGRARRPFIVVNCGAMPENLLESELFGHVRGAFTGAMNSKRGLFEEANNGTIFLDEVGETSPALQVKLLRFLQHGEVKHVGSNDVLYLNVRVIAATNRSLEKMVAEGLFRSDLYYRLNVIQILMPPLRERVDDIPLLAGHFLKKAAEKMKKPAREISFEAMSLLKNYAWPGNVRELENVMERAAALTVGTMITPADFPPQVQDAEIVSQSSNGQLTLKEVERRHILDTLKSLDWNYDQVCRALGIGRTTLWRKLKEYQVSEGE